jgi:hypothetical protein
MEKKSAKQQKAEKSPKVGIPKSAVAVAAALAEHWPKEAEKIITVMREAATSRSMQRKLARVQQAFGGLQKEAQQ